MAPMVARLTPVAWAILRCDNRPSAKSSLILSTMAGAIILVLSVAVRREKWNVRADRGLAIFIILIAITA